MRFEHSQARPACLALIVSLSFLSSCSPTPAPTPPPPAAKPAVAPPSAKPMVMICKNSQTGLKVECGTPNAVMVGMKPA